MTGHHAYTLYELNSQVRQAIGQAMPGTYWVEAELSEVRERTHCYMELVQNDASAIPRWPRRVPCAGLRTGRH